MPALDPTASPQRVAEGCVRITLPDPFVPGVTSVFLVGGEGSTWLLDTGADTDRCEAALRSGLAGFALTPESARVILSHTHLDHAGGLLRFSPAELVAHRHAVEEMRNSAPRSSRGPSALRRMGVAAGAIEALAPHGEPVGGSPLLETGIDRVLEGRDGDLPDGGGWRWYLAEGHAPGHLVLFDPATRTLLAGDQFLRKWKTPLVVSDPSFDSMGAYLESLRLALRLRPERICSSHMTTIDDPISWLEQTESAIQRRLDRVLDVAGASLCPVSAEEALSTLYPDAGGGELRIVFLREMIAMLRHLVASGRAVGTVENGVELFRAG